MDSNVPIRILQIVPNMQSGGLENFIMNVYRNIDRNKVQFDFLVHYKEKKFFDDEIEKMGGKIYRFNLRNNNNIFKYIKELNRFYKNHKEYKVIHCHMSSIGFINFLIAKKNGVKTRIAHSHNSSTDKTLKGRIKRIMIMPYKYVSNINFACSIEAGTFLFGKKKFEVIPNAIDCDKFRFSQEKRESIRNKYNISDDTILIGHIGRFNIQKNHEFLIKCFNKACETNKNIKLMLIGDGELKENIVKKVKQLNLENKIYLLGVVGDVWKYYSAFDLFVLPSLFEGLPVVGVEAQCSGVKTFLASNITNDVLLTNRTKKIDLIDKEWIKELTKQKLEYCDRDDCYNIVKESKFNIKNVSKYLQEKYIKEYLNEKD